jgi:hypothetical protein
MQEIIKKSHHKDTKKLSHRRKINTTKQKSRNTPTFLRKFFIHPNLLHFLRELG